MFKVIDPVVEPLFAERARLFIIFPRAAIILAEPVPPLVGLRDDAGRPAAAGGNGPVKMGEPRLRVTRHTAAAVEIYSAKHDMSRGRIHRGGPSEKRHPLFRVTLRFAPRPFGKTAVKIVAAQQRRRVGTIFRRPTLQPEQRLLYLLPVVTPVHDGYLQKLLSPPVFGRLFRRFKTGVRGNSTFPRLGGGPSGRRAEQNSGSQCGEGNKTVNFSPQLKPSPSKDI